MVGVGVIKKFHLFKHPLVVFWVVSFEEKLTAWFEGLFKDVEELLLNQPAFVVPRFWPWIRAEEVET